MYKDIDLTNGSSVNLVRLSTPTFSYNSYNDVFNITYICKDLNDLPYVFTHTFTIQGKDVVFLDSRVYYTNNNTPLTLQYGGTYGYFKLTTNFYSTQLTEATNIVPTSYTPNYMINTIDINSQVNPITNAIVDNNSGCLIL